MVLFDSYRLPLCQPPGEVSCYFDVFIPCFEFLIDLIKEEVFFMTLDLVCFIQFCTFSSKTLECSLFLFSPVLWLEEQIGYIT